MSHGLRAPTPAEPEALAEIFPLFERILRAFGPDDTAALLDRSRSEVLELDAIKIDSDKRLVMRILDVHDVFTRALHTFTPNTMMMWLVSPEPELFNARPIDVLRFRGSGPLVEALRLTFEYTSRQQEARDWSVNEREAF